MRYDIFFSISQTPVDGHTPTEAEMFGSFFRQVKAADELGYGVCWIAEAHLSSEVQKRHPRPVVPHWQGEIGLNVDTLQLAQKIFGCTKNLEVGPAVANILTCGGPVAAAERIAALLALHGLDPEETRRLHFGFSAGRFEFMNRAYGIVPRDAVEEAAWPALRGQTFKEAAEILCRLLRGDVLAGDEIEQTVLTRANFRSDGDWGAVQAAWGAPDAKIPIAPRFPFEPLKIVPQEWRRDLLQLVIGSRDAPVQDHVNTIMPVQVFNLSITPPEVIDATHERMRRVYHPGGGPWQRHYMPRTSMVFLNAQPGLSAGQRRARAQDEARAALSAYWTALEGTLNPAKLERTADNALIGDPDQVARQIVERFHPGDRLMLWFDFFNHDCDRVIDNIEAFAQQVVPRVERALGRT